MAREWWLLRRKQSVKTFVVCFSIKIPPGFFIGIDKLILKFMWKLKGLRLSKQSRKKIKIRELILLDFKTSKATVIKTIFDGTDIRTNK